MAVLFGVECRAVSGAEGVLETGWSGSLALVAEESLGAGRGLDDNQVRESLEAVEDNKEKIEEE